MERVAQRPGPRSGGPGRPGPRAYHDGQGLVHDSAGVDAAPVLMKPNVVDAPAPSAPLYDRFFTVATEPLVLSAPFQTWPRLWPPASVQVTVQPLIAAAPAFTVTSPWKPPDHEPIVR